VYGKTAYNKR